MTKITDSPDSITALAAEIYDKTLRTFQRKLLLEQVKNRLGSKAASTYRKLKAAGRRRRARIHLGPTSHFPNALEETLSSEGQLYFKLSSGQMLRADRVLKKSSNPAMRALVSKGVVAQAERA